MLYRLGVNNLADYVLRHPGPKEADKHDFDELCTEAFIKMVVGESCPVAMTIDELIAETEKDEVLQKAKAAMKNKQWKTFLHGSLNPVARVAMTQIWRV